MGSGRSGSSKNRVSGSEEWNVASSTSSSSSVGGAVASSSNEEVDVNAVRLKLALLGNPQVGKTSLMYKYVTGLYDEDYIQTLGTDTLPLSHLVFSLSLFSFLVFSLFLFTCVVIMDRLFLFLRRFVLSGMVFFSFFFGNWGDGNGQE